MTLLRCNFCAAVFATNRLLEAHEARHRRLYSCRVCHVHYPTRYSLFRHAKRDGHYLYPEQSSALPVNHHIPFKGRGYSTKAPAQFGKNNNRPPTVRRQMPPRVITDMYRPRVASTRIVDCRPRRCSTPKIQSLSTVKVEPKLPPLSKKSDGKLSHNRTSSNKKKDKPREESTLSQDQTSLPSTSTGRRGGHTTRFEIMEVSSSDSELDLN